MNNSDRIIQNPAPGARLLLFQDDTKTFTLLGYQRKAEHLNVALPIQTAP